MSADLVDDADVVTEHAVSSVSYHHVNVEAVTNRFSSGSNTKTENRHRVYSSTREKG